MKENINIRLEKEHAYEFIFEKYPFVLSKSAFFMSQI